MQQTITSYPTFLMHFHLFYEIFMLLLHSSDGFHPFFMLLMSRHLLLKIIFSSRLFKKENFMHDRIGI